MDKSILGEYNLVLGLEIHLHLNVDRKMFCRCSAEIYEAEPNTHTCPTCLGLPGALPVPNFDAIKKTQLVGLALNCNLNKNSKFDRKHYFYPDLPKGYQISQYKEPLCEEGFLVLSSGKKAEIQRIHLEEDTAKSVHAGNKTMIDFNMSSVALVEIVTTPCFDDVDDAVEFCKLIQKTVKDLGLSAVDMQKGQMRLEPNISLRTTSQKEANELPSYKVEIKNINSFRFMEKAVLAEIKRQRELLESGETPVQENRGFIEASNSTVSQRSKEDAHDYRYFPEPDIPPMVFEEKYLTDLNQELEELKKSSPEYKKSKLILENGLKGDVLDILTLEEVERLVVLVKKFGENEKLSNLFVNKKETRTLSDEEIGNLLNPVSDGLSNEDLSVLIDKVVSENLDAVEKYKNGSEKVLMFLVGQVLREAKGKVSPEKAKETLCQKLQNH